MQHALLVVNPQSRSGQAEALDEAIEILKNADIAVELYVSESTAQMVAKIAGYRRPNSLVIIAGGDGTISSALEAVYQHNHRLAILPMGTANDLARSLGVPQMLTDAAHIIAAGACERINLARVNDAYFVNVAHLGLGVDVTHELTPQRKKFFGVFAYLAAFFSAVKRNKSFKVHIKTDEWEDTVRAIHLAIGNGRYYGGGNIVDENATLVDGKLNLFFIKPQHWSRLLLLGRHLRTGDLKSADRVVCKTSTKISIRTSKPIRLAADGEFKTATPAEFEVIPRALEVIAGDMSLSQPDKE